MFFNIKIIWACTGFDGGLEDRAAIRVSDLVTNRKIIINADENLAFAA